MEDKLGKVKRKHVNWKNVLDSLENTEINLAFLSFKSKHPLMSVNRCAYNVLRKYYSTTAMLKYRLTGSFQ